MNMDKVQRALNTAYTIHKNQKRKRSQTPYFVHIIDTAKYLMYETRDEDIISAGLLHDALEDTNYSEEELKKDFGERVYKLVKFCTEKENKPNNTDEEQKKTWRMRKEKTIKKIENATEEQALVLCADKTSNLLSMNEDLSSDEKLWDKFNGTKKEVQWYYEEIERELEKKIKNNRIFKTYKELNKKIKKNN